MASVRNIGIFAHVDAGKTTLSEGLLAHAGSIRSRGSVDAGTAHTDTLPIERRRGISVKSKCVTLRHRDTDIRLIDTPGHVDFSAEVERSAWALDGAVLIVCAVEGVQPQTEVLFECLRQQNIPIVFFLNKLDRAGTDPEGALAQIKRLLTPGAVLAADPDAVTEALCDFDDELAERYLSGEELSPALLRGKLGVFSRKGELFPVLTGSALRDEGVVEMLDAIVDFLPEPADAGALSGVVFATDSNRSLGRGVWVRLFGGALENRMSIPVPGGIDPLTGEPKTKTAKISQIMAPDGTPLGRLEPGGIGVLYGLGELPIGHVLGDASLLPRSVAPGSLRAPLITVQVIPEKPELMTALRAACTALADEDPLLKSTYIRALNELHLQVMGTIQLEIIAETLATRFGISVTFGQPAILYRETIAAPAEGYVAYLAPKPCWAILKFRIEPGERGSGVQFKSLVPVRTIQAHYQNQVAQALPLALNQGRLGWPVTDVKITLLDGGEHKFHTHPLDFIVATPMAIQDGLERGGAKLLEPILSVRFSLPSECVGKVMTDINTMRGETVDSFADGERMILNARIPVATSLDYAAALASATGGRGAMSVRLDGYRECHLELGATTPRRSVDPLDTSKYILAARSALEGGIFNLG